MIRCAEPKTVRVANPYGSVARVSTELTISSISSTTTTTEINESQRKSTKIIENPTLRA